MVLFCSCWLSVIGLGRKVMSGVVPNFPAHTFHFVRLALGLVRSVPLDLCMPFRSFAILFRVPLQVLVMILGIHRVQLSFLAVCSPNFQRVNGSNRARLGWS